MEKNLPIGARDLPRAPRSSSKWPRGDVALIDGYIKAQTAVHTAVWAFFYAGGAVLTRRRGWHVEVELLVLVVVVFGLRSLFNNKIHVSI